MVSKECASAGSKNKSRVVVPHGSCSENAHRYEVSSRQRSMNGYGNRFFGSDPMTD